jgi:hypothetical protein
MEELERRVPVPIQHGRIRQAEYLVNNVLEC